MAQPSAQQDEMGEKFKADGGETDLSNGPVTSRRCTDILFMVLFIAHVVAFWVFSLMTASDGDFRQLIYPRDYRGQYCGIDSGVENHEKMIYTLNLTNSVDTLAYDFLCSSAGKSVANSAGVTDGEHSTACGGSISTDPFTSIQDKLDDYFTFDGVSNILEDVLGSVFINFNQVCVNNCGVDFVASTSGNQTAQIGEASRQYTYMPTPDVPWYAVWSKVVASNASEIDSFTFEALGESKCPYSDAKYCVPLAGVSFSELTQGYCIFDVDTGFLDGLSDTAVNYFEQLAESSIASELTGTADEAFGSITQTWDTFIIVAVLSFALGLTFLILLRFFIKPVVYVAVVAIFLVFVGGAIVSYVYSSMCDGDSIDASSVSSTATDPFGDDDCQGNYVISSSFARDVLEVCAYVLAVIALIYLLVVFCTINRIRLAVSINAVAAQFIYNTPHIVIIPVVQAICAIIWTALWGFMVSFLLSQVPDDFVPQGCFASYAAAEAECKHDVSPEGLIYVDDQSLSCMQDGCCYRCNGPRYIIDYRFWFSLFSFFWHHAFAVALGQCIVAGAVGIWFFNKGERGSLGASMFSVCTATKNCLTYHLGSLALGSFILAVVQTVKWFMRYCAQQAKLEHNKVLEVVFKILSYCVWCFEKSVKFLNKNAYIQIALLGKPFCRSAYNAFFLILRNIVRFGVLTGLGVMVHLLGKLLIAGATGVLGFLILEAMHDDVDQPIILVILYAVIGYMMGALFMNVFALAVDSVLHCFIATEEMGINRDFIPPKLQRFVDETSSQSKKESGCWGCGCCCD